MRLSTLVMASLLISPLAAFAAQPVTGNWWNPDESGRGWALERQNDVITITHYMYDSQGRSEFYTSSGVWDPDTNSVEGDLISFSNGQCTGCPYITPEHKIEGRISFVFEGTTKGVVTYPNGVQIPIEKMNYGFSTPTHVLQGGWATSWYSSVGTSFAHAIFFDEIVTGNSGLQVIGEQVLSLTRRPVVAGYVSGIYLTIVDASTGFYDYYYFTIDGESIRGVACAA